MQADLGISLALHDHAQPMWPPYVTTETNLRRKAVLTRDTTLTVVAFVVVAGSAWRKVGDGKVPVGRAIVAVAGGPF